MALETLAPLKLNEGNLEILAGKAGGLHALIRELRGLSVTVVNGANANTNIAVSGIATTDTLLSVLEFTISDCIVTGKQ